MNPEYRLGLKHYTRRDTNDTRCDTSDTSDTRCDTSDTSNTRCDTSDTRCDTSDTSNTRCDTKRHEVNSFLSLTNSSFGWYLTFLLKL